MTDLIEKGTGSTLTSSEWNVLKDKITDGTDSIFAGSVVISGTVNKVLSPAGTGSPVTWGKFVQAGSGVTSAGSVLWVVFGLPFAANPHMTMSSWDDADANMAAFTGSPVSTGSIRVVSQGASRRFSWIGIG